MPVAIYAEQATAQRSKIPASDAAQSPVKKNLPTSSAWRLRASWRAVLLAWALSPLSRAADEPPTAWDKSLRTAKSGDWVFEIIPKAFQNHPVLDMTFNTEVTPYGRLLRQASATTPVYYVAHDAGYRELGWPVAGLHPPPPADIKRALTTALATNGFLAAAPGQPAALLIVFYWGSHNAPDADDARSFPGVLHEGFFQRAMLVGGRKFGSYIMRGLIPMRSTANAADLAQEMESLRIRRWTGCISSWLRPMTTNPSPCENANWRGARP